MFLEKLVKFILFIKITFFDVKDRVSTFALTKYKLQEFITINNKIRAVYSIRPMRHVVRTELETIFKDKNFIKGFNKEDMVILFYMYIKNKR